MVGKTLRAAALATTCLWPLAAWADDSEFDLGDAPVQAPAPKPILLNEMGVGVGYQTDSSARFGRYTGHDSDGFQGNAWFNVLQRATGKDDGTFFFNAYGENLDITENRLLPNAALGFRVGEQSLWDASLAYQGTPFLMTDNFRTVLGSSGELLNGLAPRSLNAQATNASGNALLASKLATMDIGTQRDKLTGQISYSGLPDWKFASKLEHEHKQGTKINAVMLSSGAGAANNLNYLTFPEPVDYDTDRFTLSGDYTTKPLQAKISYILSNFTNNQLDYRFNSPFTPTITGYQSTQYSLPPSNQEHRLKGQFGFNPSDTTHVALNLSYGLQIQNEEFQARMYEPVRLDASSYDGLIRTGYSNIAVTSRPWKDWNFRTAYTLDSRDNGNARYRLRTSYRGDTTATFNGSTMAGGFMYNTPYSFLNQRVDLEAGYRVLRSTKITTYYTYTDKQREYSVTNRNQEGTVGGRVNSMLANDVTAMLGYARSVRQATQYNGNAGWAAQGRTLTGNNSEAELRMYSYAARLRDEIKGNVNWTVGSDWSLGVNARYVHDDFPDSYYGVRENNMLSAGPDIAYSPMRDVTTHLYYNYQQNFLDMAMNTTAAATGVAWELKNRDTVHTIGAGGEWKVTDRFKLSLENNLSYGNTSFEEASWWHGTAAASTAANTAVSLPTSKSVTNALKLSGEYEMMDDVFVGLSGLWERFLSHDYQNEEQAVSNANGLGTANTSATGNPSYSVGVAMATMRMKW